MKACFRHRVIFFFTFLKHNSDIFSEFISLNSVFFLCKLRNARYKLAFLRTKKSELWDKKTQLPFLFCNSVAKKKNELWDGNLQ